MPTVTMGLSNYRCFAERQEVQLRPVTVVLGRNNSGKSALVRAPLVLSTGIHTDSSSPLDLDVLTEQIVDSFGNLLYGARPHGSLHVQLTVQGDDGESVQVDARIQNIDEYRMQIVSSLRFSAGGIDLDLEWEPEDPPEEPHNYTLRVGSGTYSGVKVEFHGILPIGVDFIGDVPDQYVEKLLECAGRVRAGFDSIRYLGPFRDRPSRLYRLPVRMPTDVGTSGENTASILASDSTRQQGQLLRQLNDALGGNLLGWSIDVVERSGMHAVVLRSQDDETLEINLADTGTGIAQALPIFVQRALDVLKPAPRPVLEIIEQPELHLHPAAHAPLADLYLQAARDTNVRFLIETHSETFLLRLRRRIAERQVSPDSVAVYFVDNTGGSASARRINIDADGNLDYWPEGVFSEDYDETREILKAQFEKADASGD